MASSDDGLWTDRFYLSLNPDVTVVGSHQSQPDWLYTPVRTLVAYFDLWYITRGRGSLKVNGEWTDFAGGDLVTMFPGDRYQKERTDPTAPHSQYYAHVHLFGDDPCGFGEPLARRWPRKLSLMHQPAIAPLFAELFEAFTARPEGYQMRLTATALRILEIIFAVLRRHGGTAPLPPAYPRLLEARDYIVRWNRRDLSLQEVADHVGLSASYLSALFRRYLGCSPMLYQMLQRLRTARRHLAEGMSVTRVAYEVGFHSIHYFSRMFTKHEGRTPSDFARSCQRK